MNDFISILDSFNKASTAEAEVVKRVSIELLHYFGLSERYSWLAIKEEIERAAAQGKYPGFSKGNVAVQWIKAAQDQKLEANIDQSRSLIITEVR